VSGMPGGTSSATAGLDGRASAPPELGLRAVFRERADLLADDAAEAAGLLDQGEAAVAEPPRWRLGRTPLWTARLSLPMQALVRQVILLLTFGLVRLDSPPRGTAPDAWTLRQQILQARLPALRREIDQIQRRRQPVDHRPLAVELDHLGRLRGRLWWSQRALRLRLQILWLQIQIAVVWLWANRETFVFMAMVVGIVVGLIVLIQVLQNQQGAILDFVDSVRPSLPTTFFPDADPFMPGGGDE
jgi:hypothetical protein